MKTSKTKKLLSIILAVLMLVSSVPATVFAAEESYPVMMATNASTSKGYYEYYNKIHTVTFLDEIDDAAINGAPEAWDMSANGDGSVWGWVYLNEEATAAAGENRYDAYLAGEGGVAAHPDSTHMFYLFQSLKEIKGMENLHTGNVKKFYMWFGNCVELETADLSCLDTSSAISLELCFFACYKLKEIYASSWDVSNVTTLKEMFKRCYALETADLGGWNTSNVTSMYGVFDMSPHAGSPKYSLKNVNLSGWNTSNVTTMENMFRNCEALTELDLSSFNTAKVTTMRFMFYYCKNLKHIYAGEGWTTEAIANINDGIFNCCYALIGQTDDQSKNEEIYADKHPSAYYPPAAEYAKFREEGGYIDDASQKPVTPKYTVTYSFIGDIIPEGVTAPDASTHEEGTTVTVADNASAEHYIFSGWTTENAEVVNGEFVINNDVHFVGSWTKLYKVEYKYDENYPVPDGAPEIPDVGLWFAPGEEVPIYGTPYVPEYVFIGWTTTDAEIIADGFTMPEKDVTIYGYYKKPVESVEFLGGDIELDADDADGEKLNVYIKPEDATVKTLTYISGDESVVKVDNNGVITPVSEGTTTVTVQSVDDPTKTDTITVTVKTFVTDIEVDKTEVTLYKGETDKITGTVTPDDATNKGVTYFSENEDIVKVDENGNITATGEGTAKIIVSSEDNPDVKKEVTVTVKNPVTEITATEDFTLNVGEEKNVEAKVNEDATEKGITYETSDPGVVKIDNDGNVVAVGEGTAVITVTSKDNPDIKETVTVTVKIPVTDVTVDKTEITLGKGDTDKITGTVTPDKATNKEVTYTSDDESIVKVDENGNITAVKTGTTTIKVTSKDNPDVSEVVTVTVVPKFNVYYVYDNVNYETPENAPSLPEVKSYKAGEAVSVEDIPALDGYTFVGWTSTKVDPVSGSFTMPESDVYFKGYFKKPVEGVEINGNKEITLEKGTEHTITVTVTPDDATFKDLVFESENENIAAVDENGKIVSVNDGTTTIKVYSKDDPSKFDVITVTVLKEYDVTYGFIGEVIPEGVTAPEKKTYSEGKIVDVEKAPFKEGYIFSGWSTEDATVTDGKITVNNNVHFVGSWTKINYYDVTYEFIGEVIPEGVAAPGKVTYEEGSEVAVEEDAFAKGYRFSGWSTADVEVTDEKDFVIYNNVHFVGSWTKLYNVSYKYEGDIPDGYYAPEGGTYDAGSEVSVADEPTAEGYEFSGWVTEDADITDGKIAVNKDVVITGKWTKLYNVSYEYKGEVPAKAPSAPADAQYKAGTDVTVNAVPVVEGYTFHGWTTSDVTVADNGFEMPEKNVKLYGYFTKNVTDITVNKNEFELELDGEDEIIVTVTPDDATDKDVTFTSSDEAVVKVDEKGKITAVGEGEATITVTSKDDPTITETIKVTVKAPEVPEEPETVPVTDITVNKNEFELELDGEDEIIVTVTPDDATDKELTFTSSDETVVKVDEKGKITAVGEGEATITVTSKDDPTITETIKVTVKAPEVPEEPETVPVTDITVNKNEFELELDGEDEIIVTVTPDDATDKELTFTSSDETVVKVDEKGKITAVGEGEATITVTSKADPTITETIKVTVKAPKVEYVIEVPEIVTLYLGDTINLGVKVTPSEGYPKPTYTIADESIATVDADGNIKGINAGVTTVTVDFGNGVVYVVPVTVLALPVPPRKHHICFGKTDGIGWYEVSVNGGDFFPQGPNSTLEVEEGSILVVRVQDMWIDDEFDFYVNGKKVPMDPANTITVVVDGYMLIGALSMDVEVPDVEESVSLLDKISKFFADIINWFKNLFK